MPKKINVAADLVKPLFDKGFGSRKIATELGLKRDVVRRVLNELNIRHAKHPINTTDTILSKVYKNEHSGCWEWQGSKNNEGYGQVSYQGKIHLVHRLTYELIIGRIESDMYVCHKCDNPKCCNPAHLFIGTPRDNQIDCRLKNRNPTSKINYNNALKIKRLFNDGYSRKEISQQYSISYQQVCRIINGKYWNYVNPPADSPVTNTMQDPNTQQAEGQQEQNAQESASMDSAMEATQDSEEGGTEG